MSATWHFGRIVAAPAEHFEGMCAKFAVAVGDSVIRIPAAITEHFSRTPEYDPQPLHVGLAAAIQGSDHGMCLRAGPTAVPDHPVYQPA